MVVPISCSRLHAPLQRTFQVVRACCGKAASQVRVRFAPSPTGHMHLGGLRTALYNFLFAKSMGGKFILRIEDTDQTRIVKGAAENIERDLVWANMIPDESPLQGGQYGPYIQSQRLHHYRKYAEELVENGKAYRCFCSDKRIELLRKEALRMQAVPRYDNRCRSLKPDEVAVRVQKGEPHCIRFKLRSGPDTFNDLVYGSVSLDIAAVEGDPVILKTDGYPTYHLACVIDDHLMNISHVLRGVEWQISTPKHLQIHEALGWKPPQFAHLPLLMNPDGTKLSKRQGDIHLDKFRKSGVFPEVLLSFTTEFGGGFNREQGPKIRQRVYSMEELVQQFDFSSLNTNSCRVDLERLKRLNRSELEQKLATPDGLRELCEQLREMITFHLGEKIDDNSKLLSDDCIKKVLQWGLPRMSRLDEFVGPDLVFLWSSPDLDLLYKITIDSPLKHAETLENVARLVSNNKSLSSSDTSSFSSTIKQLCTDMDVDFRQFTKLFRAAVCGLKAGPPIGEVVDLLGLNECVHRLLIAAEMLKKRK